MKKVVLSAMLAVGCLVSSLGLPSLASAGGCCKDCCGGGRGPMRKMMGAYVGVVTMGMVTPNRAATSSVVTTNAPLTPDAPVPPS